MNRVRAGLRIPMDLNTKLILRASENGIFEERTDIANFVGVFREESRVRR